MENMTSMDEAEPQMMPVEPVPVQDGKPMLSDDKKTEPDTMHHDAPGAQTAMSSGDQVMCEERMVNGQSTEGEQMAMADKTPDAQPVAFNPFLDLTDDAVQEIELAENPFISLVSRGDTEHAPSPFNPFAIDFDAHENQPHSDDEDEGLASISAVLCCS